MLKSFKITFLILLLSPLFSTVVNALPVEEFKSELLLSEENKDKIIVLDFHATWCPTCAMQRKAITAIEEDEQFKKLKIYSVDYDTAGELIEKYNIRRQSTFVVLMDGKEVGRSIGITGSESIKNFFIKYLAPVN